MTVAPTLKKAMLFSGMEDSLVDFFAVHSHRKSFRKGEGLFAMGDSATAFFLIETGWIKIYRMNREGEESIVNVFGPGETFAEAAVFSPGQRYPVNAQAVEDCEVLEIPRQPFIEKIRDDSTLALSVLEMVSARQRYLVQQIEQLTAREAPQRLGTFFLRLCPPGEKTDIAIALPYDKAVIARCLNIQPETFSRAMKKLESHGVTAEGKNVFIENVEDLARFCDMDERGAGA